MKNNIIIGCILSIVSGLALWGLLTLHLSLPSGSEWQNSPAEYRGGAGLLSAMLSMPVALFPIYLIVKISNWRKNKSRV